MYLHNYCIFTLKFHYEKMYVHHGAPLHTPWGSRTLI